MGSAGFVMLLVGAALVLFSGKLHFDRTNEYGVEEYGSYTSAVGTTLLSTMLRGIGSLIFVFGMLLSLVSCLTPDKPKDMSISAKPKLVLSAVALAKEYHAKSHAFDGKFADAIVRVTGRVKYVSAPDNSLFEKFGLSGNARVILDGNNSRDIYRAADLDDVVCNVLDKNVLKDVAKLQVGRVATMQCVYMARLRMSHCRVI